MSFRGSLEKSSPQCSLPEFNVTVYGFASGCRCEHLLRGLLSCVEVTVHIRYSRLSRKRTEQAEKTDTVCTDVECKSATSN